MKIEYTIDSEKMGFIFSRGVQMDFLEYLYYESLPYFYAGMAAFGFMNHETSRIAGLAAAVLAFCSYKVFYSRFHYRTYSSKYKN